MSSISEEQVKKALARVRIGEHGPDVVSAGLISGVVVRDGKVGFVITIDASDKDRLGGLRAACEATVMQLPGVVAVTAVLTAEAHGPRVGLQDPTKKKAVWNQTPLEHVKKVVAIASGKGGVGKSTTAVNLALALARMGKRTALLDADIYGPSLPRMLGLSGQPDIRDGKMIPLVAHGVPCMSMGFITGEEAAILRGPMITKALHQLLRFTQWGTPDTPLDCLLVDMPPGTGDIHLSMAQAVPLSGAVIVTTPQEVAVIDARKCLQMFVKLSVPVLGVVENMSYYEDPAGAHIPLFGEGGGQKLADEAGVPFLGGIPIDMAIRAAADSGNAYAGAQARAYDRIVEKL